MSHCSNLLVRFVRTQVRINGHHQESSGCYGNVALKRYSGGSFKVRIGDVLLASKRRQGTPGKKGASSLTDYVQARTAALSLT